MNRTGFLLIFSTIIAPALFWILYFRYKDRFRPEPFINMGGSFVLGFLSGLLCLNFINLLGPAGIPEDLSALVNDFSLRSLFYLVFIVGFVEELFKLLMFIFVVKWFKNFDDNLDGIIYSSVIALGFASYENLIYLPYISGIELIGRSIASPLTHTIFSSIWGFYAGDFFLGKRERITSVGIMFILSFFLHGLYDFFSLSGSLRFFSSILILIVWIWRINLIEQHNRLLK